MSVLVRSWRLFAVGGLRARQRAAETALAGTDMNGHEQNLLPRLFAGAVLPLTPVCRVSVPP